MVDCIINHSLVGLVGDSFITGHSFEPRQTEGNLRHDGKLYSWSQNNNFYHHIGNLLLCNMHDHWQSNFKNYQLYGHCGWHLHDIPFIVPDSFNPVWTAKWVKQNEGNICPFDPRQLQHLVFGSIPSRLQTDGSPIDGCSVTAANSYVLEPVLFCSCLHWFLEGKIKRL